MQNEQMPDCREYANGSADKANEYSTNYTTFRSFTLSVATGITQQRNNRIYATQSVIHNLQELIDAVQFDHVAGIFKNNHRCTENFIQADVLMMDCDNDHTDDTAKWLTPEILHQRLQGVPFAIAHSKSHMKTKAGDKDHPQGFSPRPRFHVYMPLSETIKNAEHIATLKRILLDLIPEFDAGAKDTARYFNGFLDQQAQLFAGDTCIDTYLAGVYADFFEPQQQEDTSTARDDDSKQRTAGSQHGRSFSEQATAGDGLKGYWDFVGNPDGIIPEGERHERLLQIAIGALMNEDRDSARATYERACRQCRPPHNKQDIARIWHDAKEYTKKKMQEQQAQQEQQQQAGRKRRSKPLDMAVITQTLTANNITVQFNVIAKELEISGLPAEHPAMPPEYGSMPEYKQRKLAPSLLPLFLTPILKHQHFTFSDKFLADSIEQIAKMHERNPIQDMLDATTWDGIDRISILIDKLELCHSRHGNKSGYYCSCLKKWLHQALALAFNDTGTRKPAFVLTLQGRQGIGKTNFFRALAVNPDWFREGTTINTEKKDTIIQATSVWICELGELDSTLKKEQSDLKSFLTATRDTYRRPYAKTSDTIERRTCFCATVNPQEVNRDITGSRRFVYIPLDGIDATAFKEFIYHTMTPEWCCQLWRQVYEELYLPDPEAYYMAEEALRLTEENNAPFRQPIKAETELRDLIDWYKIGTYDDENEPFDDFAEYTATDIKKAYQRTLSRYDSRIIGKAMKLLCEEYRPLDITGHGATMRTLHGRILFSIPRLNNREDEDTDHKPARWNGYQG